MFYKKRKFKNQRSNGFTLVESLVAITVLLIGVLGPLVLATRSISDGISLKNKVAASYLAQEGVELGIAKRDKNVPNNEWRTGLVDLDGDGGADDCTSGCSIEFDQTQGDVTLAPCNGNSCNLQFDVQRNEYSQTPAIPDGPIFTREITITEDVLDQRLSFESKVTWSEKGVPQKAYILKNFLYKKI